MKAMMRPNRPVASASAKPSSAGVVIWFCEAGLRAIELTSAAKMLPIPTPAPTRAMQARPAPIILAEARSMVLSFAWLVVSVQVDGVVQVDAGQDGEDVSLQHGDQQLEQDEEDVEGERQDAEDPHGDDEAGEDHQHGVAGHQVGEQPDRQRQRPEQMRG